MNQERKAALYPTAPKVPNPGMSSDAAYRSLSGSERYSSSGVQGMMDVNRDREIFHNACEWDNYRTKISEVDEWVETIDEFENFYKGTIFKQEQAFFLNNTYPPADIRVPMEKYPSRLIPVVALFGSFVYGPEGTSTFTEKSKLDVFVDTSNAPTPGVASEMKRVAALVVWRWQQRAKQEWRHIDFHPACYAPFNGHSGHPMIIAGEAARLKVQVKKDVLTPFYAAVHAHLEGQHFRCVDVSTFASAPVEDIVRAKP